MNTVQFLIYLIQQNLRKTHLFSLLIVHQLWINSILFWALDLDLILASNMTNHTLGNAHRY